MIKPGSRWRSRVCSAQVICVRPPNDEGLPQCGGVDMVPVGEDAPPAEMAPQASGGCSVGKRYRSPAAGLELLCTAAGAGALGFAGELLDVVEAKALPSSD